MPHLRKLLRLKKNKREGSSDERAAAGTSSATVTVNTNDQSTPTETELATENFTPPTRFISSEKEKIGLFELSKAEPAKTIDVVAVHGLQGDAFKTWEHENNTLWLRDLLPAKIPTARIMTFGYESTIAFSKSVAHIEDKALDLLNRLSAQRDENTDRRPIVFICHSLGGILVKKALVLAHERSSDPAFKDLLMNTKSIAFLGVPHKGSDSAWWANFAANALKGASIGLSTNNALVADLRKDSSVLSNISKQFIDRGRDLTIYTFYERLRLHGVLVVDELSAQLGLPNEKPFPVDADHRTICKISSSEDQVYKVVVVWIAKLIKSTIEKSVPIENHPMATSKSLVDLLKAKSPLCLNTLDTSLPVPAFESPEYVKWTSGETNEILWYRGKPGCGKSVMVSQLLKRLFEDQTFTEAVTFFDFEIARNLDRSLANIPGAVISFIAAQLFEFNTDSLSAMNGEEQEAITSALLRTSALFSYESSSTSESQRVIPGLVSALRMIPESILWSCLCRIIDHDLETMSRIYLIFDGDDSALPEDRYRFLRNIRTLWERSENAHSGCIKILIASRDYPKAREVLHGLSYLDNEKEQQDCINSLGLGAANARMALIEDGEKKTGEWILSNRQYCDWKEESGSALLWLQGNPGTGKSTLVKQIQNRLCNEAGLSKVVVATFYYSAREGETEMSHTHMLQALLHQILLQETEKLYPFFRPVFRDKREQMQPWRFDEMQRIFVSLSKSHSDSLSFYLLLDALDESDRHGIPNVISLLKEVTALGVKLKVLVASRPGPIISSRLAGSEYHLILEERNKRDIETMIASRIGFLRESNRITFEWIASYILSRARGVFLWVSLILSDINRLILDDGWSEAELRARVEALPVSLVPYYQRITSLLALQEPVIVAEGVRMLYWVVYSERPLTVHEFRDAVAITSNLKPFEFSSSILSNHRLKWLEHVPKRLMRNCGELVEVKRPTERTVESLDVDPGAIVQLFHETVREFLKDPNGTAAPFDMKENLGHAEIAVVCARYIRISLILGRHSDEERHGSRHPDNPRLWEYETHRMFAQHLSDRPLLAYALKFLPRHMNFLEDRDEAKAICLECFTHFDSDHELLFLSNWLQTSFYAPLSVTTIKAEEAARFRISSLVAAADQGFATAVRSLIEAQTTLDAVEETTNHSALQVASKNGHLEVVNILIKNEASINFLGGHFGTALQAAAYSGHKNIVATLLTSGADPNSEGGYLLRPFFAARCMGYQKIAALLDTAGADDRPPDDLFRNIWDSSELGTLVQNAETVDSVPFARILIEAVKQFQEMSLVSTAEEIGLRAIDLFERTLGGEHPETLGTALLLANLFLSHDNLEEAEVLTRKGLEIRDNVLSVYHPLSLDILETLALILEKQGKMEEAEVLCSERTRNL